MAFLCGIWTMKKLIPLLLIFAVLAGVSMANLGERRVYPLRPGIKYLFTGSRDPNCWWDDVNDVYILNGMLEVLDVTVTGDLDVNDVNIVGDLTLEGLTASRLLYLDSDSNVASVADFTDWIAGTANQITVTDDTDGTITLSLPQDIHIGASPTFAGLLATDKIKFTQTDGNEYVDSLADGYLDLEATTGIRFRINDTEQLYLADGLLTPTTDNDIDLGTFEYRISHGFFWDVRVSALTASRLVRSSAFDDLGSVTDLTAWLAGTANEIDIADDGDGTVTIGITDPFVTNVLVVGSNIPSSGSDTGTAGTITYNSSYIYVCIDTDTWERVAISSWGVITDVLLLDDGASKLLLDDGSSFLLIRI